MINFKTLSVVIAALLLAVSFTQCKNADCNGGVAIPNDSTQTNVLKIAYVDTDSLLRSYTLAQELNNEMLQMQETMRANINERTKAFEKEVAEFQRKAENNAFLSPDRAQQESQRLANEERKLQEYAQKLELEALQSTQKMQIRVNDSIQNYIDEVLSSAYDIVLTQVGTLHVTKKMDITEEVIKGLNARYKK